MNLRFDARRLMTILLILIGCIGLDQATKAVAKESLDAGETVVLMGGSIRLQLAKNYGTFLSLGASLPAELRNTLTTVGVGAILLALFGYALFATVENSLVVPSLALLLGGGLSNLLDRIAYGGYVVDFLNVGIGALRTGIFNVADMFIMSGVIVMLFSEPIQRRLARGRSAETQ